MFPALYGTQLLNLQQPATGRYPKPSRSTPHPPTLFLEDQSGHNFVPIFCHPHS